MVSLSQSGLQESDIETILDKDGLPIFKCKYCEITNLKLSHMKIHVRKHTKETPYKCNICEKSFPRMGSLNSHKNRVHEKKTRRTCFVCQKGFFDKHGLLTHLVIHDDARDIEVKYLPVEMLEN